MSVATDAEERATACDHVEPAIGGMTCASCAARIEKRLNRLPGVHATADSASEHAAVVFDPMQASVADLIGAVEAAGYEARIPEAVAEEDPGRPYRRNPIAAAAMSLSSIFVVANSLRLRRFSPLEVPR